MSDRSIRVTVESDLDDETAERYYALYHDTFQELEIRAVARQLLHRHEFLEEIHDPRVMKYVAWDGERPIGLTTLTKDLATVPWISPAYFAHHYPEQTARGIVYYLGFTLVEREHQQSNVFTAMIDAVIDEVHGVRGVCAWDMCHYNNEILGLGPIVAKMLGDLPGLEVGVVDTQTYFAGVHELD